MNLVEDPKFTRLKISGQLPTPKGIALEVIKLTQQSDVSNQAVAHMIKTDPALSVRVIKAANMLLANSSRPVVTIADAVMVLGTRGLRQLVLGIALIADYRHGPCRQFDYAQYWNHSLLTGIAAKHLAQYARLAAADEIFVVGLFSQIGQLALASVFSDEYGALLVQARGKSSAVLYAEQRMRFGFDESELSAAMLADMHFPVIFQNLVRYCSQPEDSDALEPSREWRLLQLLHIASAMAGLFLSKPSSRSSLVKQLRQYALRMAMDWNEFVALGEACLRDWQEWSGLLGMGGELIISSFAELFQSEEEGGALMVDVPIEPSDYPLRVLLVDDDRTTLALLNALLQGAGHQVQLASNGEQAMRLIEQQPPQVLISDWIMPEMDGITLCRKLREHADWRSIYMVILTSQENPDKLVEAFEAGVDDYLLKPVNQKIFFARLRAGQRVIRMQEELAFEREQLQRFSNELAVANQRLQQLALTDALTGLPNRRAAMERLEQEWSMMQRSDRPLACMMLDIDHFKSVNDRLGHPVGDIALKFVAQTLRHAARAQDVVCRFGGEEFLVICPDTDIDAAYQCAERLREQVALSAVTGVSPPLRLTLSLGVVSVNGGKVAFDELLSRADQCLYAAKKAGRNRTIFEKY